MSEDNPIILEPTEGFVDAPQSVTAPATPAETEATTTAEGSPVHKVALEAVKGALASLAPAGIPDEWRAQPRAGSPEWREDLIDADLYCLQMEVYMVSPDTVYAPPRAHAWTEATVKLMLRQQDGVPIFDEVTIIGLGIAILSEGRAHYRLGIPRRDAQRIAYNMTHPVRWLGLEAEQVVVPIPFAEGRRVIARARAEAHVPAGRPLLPYGPQWNPPDGEGGSHLQGAAPPSGRGGQQPPPTTRGRGRARAGGRGSRITSPGSALSSSPSPVRASPISRRRRKKGYHTDSEASASSRHGSGHTPRPKYNNQRVVLPTLTNLGEGAESEYRSWRKVVQSFRASGSTDAQIFPQAYMSLHGIVDQLIEDMDGVLDLECLLRQLDQAFGVASDYHTLMRQMWGMEQGQSESVLEFAARVTAHIEMVKVTNPSAVHKDDRRKVLHGGLRDDLKLALSHLRGGSTDGCTYDALLDEAKRLEKQARAKTPKAQSYSGRASGTGKSYFQTKSSNNGRTNVPASARVAMSPGDPDMTCSDGEQESEASEGNASASDSFAVFVRAVDVDEAQKRKCFKCGSTDHLYRSCPSLSDYEKSRLNQPGVARKQGARNPPSAKQTQATKPASR